jgi:hypothetical protein
MKKQNYRIVEYKDYFTIERKGIEPVFKSFLGFKYKVGEKPYWSTAMKKQGYFTWSERLAPKNYQFKTKQECLEWIADKEKYPIYHYNILNEPNKSGLPKFENPPPPPPRTIKQRAKKGSVTDTKIKGLSKSTGFSFDGIKEFSKRNNITSHNILRDKLKYMIDKNVILEESGYVSIK